MKMKSQDRCRLQAFFLGDEVIEVFAKSFDVIRVPIVFLEPSHHKREVMIFYIRIPRLVFEDIRLYLGLTPRTLL
jgi:hypothetical protein